MAYTILIIKDSRILREDRLIKESFKTITQGPITHQDKYSEENLNMLVSMSTKVELQAIEETECKYLSTSTTFQSYII